ncbi:hypothetical protein GBK02_15955 [Dechloromonas sp. TW-R-39-2]|uniref:hypothetical protein n=1 Tax=Dechloromonas sp. TW-R-39-2 TaxID=2654218 RepID=UPI00193CEAFC|nr:hypothetical protein [Dechloromonas sp. TW-R-39-2]QRM20761.1 hypothetical protein GBK02_15955 [Dechloromonas sp. TW-R-39-2]
MVSNNLTDQLIDENSDDENISHLKQLAEILIAAIPEDRRQIWAGKIMVYLAQEALRSASQENRSLRVSTKAIHTDLAGNPNLEPSQWLSPIWKEIETRYLPEIEPVLIELSRKAGLDTYPIVQKENGKPAYYRLASRPLPGTPGNEMTQTMPALLPQAGGIYYKRDLSLKLSTFGQFLFADGLKWTPSKRYGYLTWQLLFLIFAVCFEFLIWLVLWYRTQPITGQDLLLFALGIGFPWVAHRYFSGIFQLFEDRIVIAPDWALAWKEFGATIEINRARDTDTPSTIHVSRYSATCPVCGWMVKLERGETTHPKRIVGRCEENPREHVFSFDRATKQGVRLV